MIENFLDNKMHIHPLSYIYIFCSLSPVYLEFQLVAIFFPHSLSCLANPSFLGNFQNYKMTIDLPISRKCSVHTEQAYSEPSALGEMCGHWGLYHRGL